ncbi:MAG: helix-turn-helix domain-containing protein [Spirochaetia bacterium]|jgi:predicted ArsR family transcriptional regulator|nr:helix-turn-helix domain-containing protein [Spirochaetia bacterium]
MKTITLTTDAQLRIYMQPLRQKILRLLSIKGPMTAKMVADTLSITSSSAKHHLLRLESIGVVEVDHTQQIHGITATFFRNAPVTVSLGSDFSEDREILAQDLLRDVQEGFFRKIHNAKKGQSSSFEGDMLTGVLHLTQSEADELYELIRTYISSHETKKEESLPFVYSLVAYRE